MKIKKGLKFTDKKKEGKYIITTLSRKKNVAFIYDRKYKVTFYLPIKMLENYLEENNKKVV